MSIIDTVSDFLKHLSQNKFNKKSKDMRQFCWKKAEAVSPETHGIRY